MMSEPPQPLNRAAYPQPVLGNPVSTLMESGVGNCYPGLEFDLRQLDTRFFPGLTFDFLGIEPSGPDGTQGAHLINADAASDPIFQEDRAWIATLRRQLNGPEGAALGSGNWYLHWVEQQGKRIELYDFDVFQNATYLVPYEGETCWWIIRSIEADPDESTADLTIALSQRDANGQPTGTPVVLHGKRRRYLDEAGMIPEVYRPGELTASMCSPWTHDFRDCACQYWAANHPDIVLGPVHGYALEDGTSRDDATQAVTFLDWMRRRGTAPAVMAEATLERSRPDAYDPYEINLRWQELDFVLQGEETDGTPDPKPKPKSEPDPNEQHRPTYPSVEAAMADLREELAPLEFTLSMVYLYALFSLRAPEEVTAEEHQTWHSLAEDLAAARQSLLAVAVSEMTHLRWVNQMLWTLGRAGFDTKHPYKPVVRPLPPPAAGALPDDLHARVRMLRPASPTTLEDFVDIERPAEAIDTEYAGLVEYLRQKGFPAGLHELAVRIDSDGLQHYQRFRSVATSLSRYASEPRLYLRPIVLADASDPSLMPALDLLDRIVKATENGYEAEFRDDMPAAEAAILEAREAMRAFQIEAERLARDEGKGIPFFARWKASDRAP
jgi:hypothetical protein